MLIASKDIDDFILLAVKSLQEKQRQMFINKSFGAMSHVGSTTFGSDGNEGGKEIDISDEILDLALSSSEEEEEEDKIVQLNHGPLLSKYYEVECPFIWENFERRRKFDDVFIDFVETKIYHPKHWKIFSFKLYFVYTYCCLGETSKALENLKFCEKFMNDHSNEEFFKEIIECMIHAINGTKAHLYYRIGDTDKADEVISKVTPLKELNNESKAALLAIQAHVLFEIPPKAKEKALEMLNIAIELDPDEKGVRRGAWYYYAGKIIGQLRRMKKRLSMPSKEELKLLERSVKINPYPVALATLAESYREAAAYMYFNKNAPESNERIQHRLGNEARRLYRTAIDMNDLNASTLRRCGHGLMKLSYKYKDLPLAKECLHKAIELDPTNCPAYLSLGLLAHKYGSNYEEALKYYKLSLEHGGFVAIGFIIQVQFLMDRNYIPLDDCKKYLRLLFGNLEHMAEIAVIRGEYHLFEKNDLIEAAKDWMRAIILAPKSDNVVSHTCRLTRKKLIINVYDYLQDEIKIAMKSNAYEKQDLLFLCKVLKICEERDSIKCTSRMIIGVTYYLVSPKHEPITDDLNLSLLFDTES